MYVKSDFGSDRDEFWKEDPMVCWILVPRIHGFLEIFKGTLNLSCRHAISSLGMGMGLSPGSRSSR